MKNSFLERINVLSKPSDSTSLTTKSTHPWKSKYSKTFLKFLNRLISVSYTHLDVYKRQMQDALKALKKFKKNLDTFKFENIDFQFLTEFENFMRKRGANDGGIGVYMRNIRTIYNLSLIHI